MRRHPRVRTLALLAAVALAGACLTPKREAELGAEEAEKVAQQMGLLQDEALGAYVHAIGAKLVAVSERTEGPWEFHIVDVPEPNAFALPGGFVYVTRGLLSLTNDEDELAGVIGHEIGHVTARHASKRIGASLITLPVNLAAGIAGAAVSIVSAPLGRVLAGTGQLVTGGLVLAPFSREQEHEADAIGQGLAAKAGYDPNGITRFLGVLEQDSELSSGEKSRFHFLDSHPMTPDRMTRTAERGATLERAAGKPVASDRAEFLDHLDGIVVGADPAQGLFEKNVFLHPELGIALEFPKGWETQNAADAVGAISPPKDAVVSLRIAEMDSTVEAVVEKTRKEEPRLEFQSFEVRGLPAARTTVDNGSTVVVVTFVGYGGIVYGIVGYSGYQTAKGYAPVFASVAESFRALRNSERERITEDRLRIRRATGGETPEALAKRTGSSWKPAKIAVANGVGTDAHFADGDLVKVSISQAYTPR